MKKLLFTVAAAILITSKLSAQSPPAVQTNVVKLTQDTRLVWEPNTEPNIHGYWAAIEQGTNVWKHYTRTNSVNLLDINPKVASGTYRFSVTAVNTEGFSSIPAILSTNLTKIPSVVLRLRIETTIEVN